MFFQNNIKNSASALVHEYKCMLIKRVIYAPTNTRNKSNKFKLIRHVIWNKNIYSKNKLKRKLRILIENYAYHIIYKLDLINYLLIGLLHRI